jgi:nucleotide-binding universal stress UspA family protein
MAEIRNILFPTDFSEHSNRAFPFAAALARAFGAKITMLHVAELEESDPANPEHTFPALDAFEGETERVTVRGHAPYKDILDISRQKNCDLIVMATHGRSEVAQFFLGRSVAEDVSRHAEVPVFIVPVHDDSAAGRPGELRAILLAGGGAARTHAEALAQKLGAQMHETDSRDADEIVRQARERDVDLIVVTEQTTGSLREEVVGTAADRVIQNAHCPVMTVRG